MRSLPVNRLFILLIVCYAFFFFGNSFVSLTDPDEVFYTLTAKEMIAKHSWLTPYIFNQPQFEKPIFLYWLLKISFKVFGETPFAARFFPAVFATFGVIGVYWMGLLGFKNEHKAFMSALVLASAMLFLGMGKMVFTDMIFAVFILGSLLSFTWGFFVPKYRNQSWVLFYFSAALASLTKGPLGLLIPELVVILFLLYRRQFYLLRTPWLLAGLSLYLLMTLPWYVDMYQHYGQTFIHEFFYNDHWRRFLEAEHKSNDRWYFYPITVIAGFFPWSLFVLAACGDLYRKLRTAVEPMDHLLLSWILVTFVVFQPAHSKLASYILPIFPAVALLTGGFIHDCLESGRRHKVRIFVLVAAGALALLGVAVVAAYSVYKKYIPSVIPAYFFSGSLIALSGFIVVLISKTHLRAAVYLLSATALPLILALFMLRWDLEPYVSSFAASNYLPHRSGVSTVILTSKPYARGVRYYTGEDIAVFDLNGSNYFSPHPIPILKTNEDVLVFLRAQKVTYALLKKSAYEDLLKLSKEGGFAVQLLKQVGYNYVLKLTSPGNA